MSTVLLSAASNPATSFTPTLTFGGAAVGMTFASRAGIWVRVGSLIFIAAQLNLSAKGSSTGTATVGGLPAPTNATTYVPLSIYGDTLASITSQIAALAVPGSPTIQLYQLGNGSASVLTHANFNNTSSLMVAGVYSV